MMETAIDDLQEYINTKMVESQTNQDLIHDQILTSNQEILPRKTTDYETVKVTSFNDEIKIKPPSPQKPVKKFVKKDVPATSKAMPGSKRT